MVGVYPYAIGVSVCGILALLFYSSGISFAGFSGKLGVGFRDRLDRADMTIKPEEFALLIVGIAVILWLAIVAIDTPGSMIGAGPADLLGLRERADRGRRQHRQAVGLSLGQVHRRVGAFVTQLELVLRMLAGALRVGLGLRQAIILVTEEVPDPARREFMRVIGRTNLGLPIVDALDELAKSMPTNEMQMFAKVVRVQQQTGGDLAKVLEKLGGTIRDRRRVIRKMGALTAQGRFGAGIIGSLPVLVGGFVVATQPTMGGALLHTFPGHIALGLFVVLEGLAIYSLSRILRFDV